LQLFKQNFHTIYTPFTNFLNIKKLILKVNKTNNISEFYN